jgi:ribose-phosphate pyrophosphokinase
MIEPDGRVPLLLFSGPANPQLAQAISGQLDTRLGEMTISTFRDSETRVVVQTDVRGADVYAVQPTSAPVNEHLVELLLMLDAFHRSGAARCTAVVPYYGYSRQERRTTPEEPISAKLVANLLTAAGADQIITMDLTVGAIEGFFDLPVEHLRAASVLAHAFAGMDPARLAVVAPDLGAVKRAEAFQRLLAPSVPVAVVFKQRTAPDQVRADDMAGDVQGRDVILVDDIISTGATMLAATRLALLRGARSVLACATHGVFAPGAVEALLASPLERVVVSNTIAVQPRERLQVVSVAALIAETIDRMRGRREVPTIFAESALAV